MKNEVFSKLMDIAGPAVAGENVTIARQEALVPTRFRIAELAAGVHAACGAAAAALWELRSGRRQKVEVDSRDAVASFQSYVYLGGMKEEPRHPSFGGFYPTRDGRWFYLHPSLPDTAANRNAIAVLNCERNSDSAAASISRWDAQVLEDALAEAGCCAAMCRSADEWLKSPQGDVLKNLPAIEILKIGDSPPVPFPRGRRPLAGVRALDLTRILAGPTCARTLAEHGADVLRIDSPHLPDSREFAVDTGHGKRAAYLDLRIKNDVEKMKALIRGTDVFSQGYRLGALAGFGFAPEALAEMRPGIVCVSVNCYGHEGPWKNRRGWEQLAQTVTGLAMEEGNRGKPRLQPSVAATDYGTGYMAAFGAMVALNRRAREGGSLLVRASLCQTGMLLHGLGRESEEDVAALKKRFFSEDHRKSWAETELFAGRFMGMIPYLTPDELGGLSRKSETPYGKLSHLSPVVKMSETPARWDKTVVPRGHGEPVWL